MSIFSIFYVERRFLFSIIQSCLLITYIFDLQNLSFDSLNFFLNSVILSLREFVFNSSLLFHLINNISCLYFVLLVSNHIMIDFIYE